MAEEEKNADVIIKPDVESESIVATRQHSLPKQA